MTAIVAVMWRITARSSPRCLAGARMTSVFSHSVEIVDRGIYFFLNLCGKVCVFSGECREGKPIV
ncbi:MAG: hypothetical protein R3Y67_00735 [Eubacteriales bacterium]